MSESRHGGCGEDVAAYALGALDAGEARAFERHLTDCTVCREELGSFQGIVNGIAASAPRVDAPGGLKRAVMRGIDAERAVTSPRRRRARIPFGAAGGAFAAGLAFAVAAVVVVVLALPGKMANRTIPADVAGTGTASLNIAGGHAELAVHDFAAPPKGDIYEVWLQHGTRAASPTTALFGVDRDGNASVDVPGSLYGVSHVMVTAEPAGGSRHPTHAPVITVAVYG